MIQGIITQGTTPKHEFTLPFDIAQIKDLRISYGQKGKEILVKQKKDCECEGTTVKVRLTQQDTLLFSTHSLVDVQIKVLTTEKILHINEDDIQLRVRGALNDEVLT